MSNAIFVPPPGLAWNSTRTPIWSTTVKSSVSGREVRSANMSYPLWQYKMSFEFLRARTAFPEMQYLAGFYNARQGSYDTFLFSDPDDFNVNSIQAVGVGDGTTRTFQLVRTFGGNVEPVWDAIPVTVSVFLSGVVQAGGVALGSTGLLTFTTAPGAGVVVGWTGQFYWRCRFLKDNLDFQQFMRQLWDLRSLEFITVKP